MTIKRVVLTLSRSCLQRLRRVLRCQVSCQARGVIDFSLPLVYNDRSDYDADQRIVSRARSREQ